MRLDVAHPTFVALGVVHGVDARIEWCLSILFTTQVLAQCGECLRLIFAHRRTSIGTNKDDAIAAETHQKYQQARERQFEEATTGLDEPGKEMLLAEPDDEGHCWQAEQT